MLIWEGYLLIGLSSLLEQGTKTETLNLHEKITGLVQIQNFSETILDYKILREIAENVC